MKHNLKRTLFLALSIAVILSGINYAVRTEEQPAPVVEPESAEVESSRVQIFIDGFYRDELVTIEAGKTVLELLEKLNDEKSGLQLVTKDFGEVGVLVEAMGGRVNGTDNQYWQYEVNGVVPMIGADQYELQSGDSVVWEFKASEY